MSDFYGSDFIYDKLLNDASVTSLVGTWEGDDTNTYPSIHNALLIPESDESRETINFYRSGNYDASLEYFQVEYSVDCRGKAEYNSFEIAMAVVASLNRVNATLGGVDYFGVCTVLPTIRPIDQSDVYNTPVLFRLRRK
jgi:hypothetical protein